MDTKRCQDLQDTKYTLVTDSQDVIEIARDAGFSDADCKEFTAAIVEVGDGEYNEIWLTVYNTPYELKAIYHTPRYWLVPSTEL